MNRGFFSFFLSCFFLLFLVSCQRSPVEEKIIAIVNDEVLTEDGFYEIYQISKDDSVSIQQKMRLINRWIDLNLLSEDIKEKGDKKIENIIDFASKQMRANYLIDELVGEIRVSEDELLDYYRLHQNKFTKDSIRFKLQLVTTNSKDKYSIIKEDFLSYKKKFSEIAKKYSEDKYAKGGGFTGFLTKDDVDSQIYEKVVNGKQNILYFLTTNGNYLAFRFYSKQRFSTIKSFDSVKDEIYNSLLEEKKTSTIKEYLQILKKRNRVEINI